MLYHYLKLSFRNLSRHSTFSIINILGLTIGLTSFILIGLYVMNEFSFDRFHPGHGQIFRVNKVTNEKGGKPQNDGITPGLLAPATVKEIPGVVAATRFRPWFNDMLVSYDSTRLKLGNVVYADGSFLQVFNFPLLHGDKKTALSEPYTAVISETTAKKYFNDKDPMGKVLTTMNNIQVKVTGVSKDVPGNSSIFFDMLISWETVAAPANKNYFFWMNNWTTQVVYTFIQLDPSANMRLINDKISGLIHKYRDETEFQFKPWLQPFDQIHLNSEGILYSGQFRTNSSRTVFTLIIIGGFIMLIACFNFINLTTAGALRRAKETGVQKVLGAHQSQLILKFFIESFLLCTFSLLFALLLAIFLLPYFSRLTGTDLSRQLLMKKEALNWSCLLLLTVSVIAGFYPAIFLAKFKSTDVFRNTIRAGKDGWLRKSLVTIQFTISIVLIIGTLIIHKQIQYLGKKDLGFDKEQVLVIPITNTGMEGRSKEFINRLKQDPGIMSVSTSNRVPGQGLNAYGILPEGHRQEEHLMTNMLETDADFAATYNIKLSNGRFFSPAFSTDTNQSIVINEAMARYLNWKNPLGKQLEIFETRKGRIIGVVKDFNFASLRESVQPLAFILNYNPLYLSVKLRAGAATKTIPFINREWKKLDAEYPFDYFFIDEQLNRFYATDKYLLHALSLFAMVAIGIACMGLFGLSIYMAEQRTKEIGIRKVLGASVANIAFLISGNFMKLVLLSAIISFPLAWWVLKSWLDDFAFRVSIGVDVFIIAAGAAAVIATITVGYESIRAATANPLKSLRNE